MKPNEYVIIVQGEVFIYQSEYIADQVFLTLVSYGLNPMMLKEPL